MSRNVRVVGSLNPQLKIKLCTYILGLCDNGKSYISIRIHDIIIKKLNSKLHEYLHHGRTYTYTHFIYTFLDTAEAYEAIQSWGFYIKARGALMIIKICMEENHIPME